MVTHLEIRGLVFELFLSKGLDGFSWNCIHTCCCYIRNTVTELSKVDLHNTNVHIYSLADGGELQIRGGINDNSKIIFIIYQ